MPRRSAPLLLSALALASGCESTALGSTGEFARSYGVIYGMVTGPDGTPVPGARVQMRENVRAAAIVSSTGSYRLSVESYALSAAPQTAQFVIIAPPGSAVRDTTERHARVTLYLAEPVPDSTAVSFVADQRR